MNKNSFLLFLGLLIIFFGYFFYTKNSFDFNHPTDTARRVNESKQEKIYIDSEGLFRFGYPGSVTVNQFVETSVGGEERKIILGRGEGARESFQIAVSAFSDTDPITDKKIKEDIPDQIIREAQNIQVKGALGVAFLSSPAGTENIREVWFSHGGFLYQISALSDMDQIVAHMIDTWVWGEE